MAVPFRRFLQLSLLAVTCLTGCIDPIPATVGRMDRPAIDISGNVDAAVSATHSRSIDDARDLFRIPDEHRAMLLQLQAKRLHTPQRADLRFRAGDLIQRVQRISSGWQPCWVSTHLLLTVGQRAGVNGTESSYQQEVIDRVLRPKDEGAFLVRDLRPYPRFEGDPDFRQSHHDQFLYKMSTAGLSIETPLSIESKEFTIRDVLLTSLATADPTGDLEWTVAAYAWFLRPDACWKNKFGDRIGLVQLIEEDLRKASDACGGAHRLISLARAFLWSISPDSAATRRLREEVRSALEAEARELLAKQKHSGAFAIQPGKSVAGTRLDNNASELLSDVYFTAHSVEWMAIVSEDARIPDHSLEQALAFLLEAGNEVCDDVAQMPSRDRDRFTHLGILAHVCSALQIALIDLDSVSLDALNRSRQL